MTQFVKKLTELISSFSTKVTKANPKGGNKGEVEVAVFSTKRWDRRSS